MSDDLTEKVARAIFDELCPGEHSPLARSQYARQRRYKAAARAAINAMSDVREALEDYRGDINYVLDDLLPPTTEVVLVLARTKLILLLRKIDAALESLSGGGAK